MAESSWALSSGDNIGTSEEGTATSVYMNLGASFMINHIGKSNLYKASNSKRGGFVASSIHVGQMPPGPGTKNTSPAMRSGWRRASCMAGAAPAEYEITGTRWS